MDLRKVHENLSRAIVLLGPVSDSRAMQAERLLFEAIELLDRERAAKIVPGREGREVRS
jgi:hypothetical protein